MLGVGLQKRETSKEDHSKHTKHMMENILKHIESLPVHNIRTVLREWE